MVRKRGRVLRNVARALAPRNARLNAFAFGNALGKVAVIMVLVYAVMVWFGGFDGSVITSQFPLSFSFGSWTVILGLIEAYVMGYVFGWIFVKIYNKFA